MVNKKEGNVCDDFKNLEKLYHFTKYETALAILRSGALRFGRLDKMNDIHESCKLIYLQEKRFENSMDCKKTGLLLDYAMAEYSLYRQISLTMDKKKGKGGFKHGFDLHQMWGHYGEKGDGVCLVFDKEKMLKIFENQCKADIIKHQEIAYQDEICSDIDVEANNLEEVKQYISTHLESIYFCKRKEWEHEQEYRLIKRCSNPHNEEYLYYLDALKYIIVCNVNSEKDRILYYDKISRLKIAALVNDKPIPILIYGNGLNNYALDEENNKTLWSTEFGYEFPNIGDKGWSLDI